MIARGDGTPLYNFAVAVDDLEMGITDVIRGDDHLSNTPKQLLVLEALGADAAALRAPAAAPRPRRQEALQAPRRRLGAGAARRAATCRPRCATTSRCSAGAPRTTRRSSRPRELVERFSIERVGRSSAIFDERKLRWLNGRYMRELPLDRLRRGGGRPSSSARATPRRPADRERLAAACAIAQEKAQTLDEVWPLIAFLFEPPVDDPKAWAKVMERDGVADGARRRRSRSCARPSRSTRRRSRRELGGAGRAARAQAARRSISRCGSRSPARRSRRGSSSRSRRSGASVAVERVEAATRACAAASNAAAAKQARPAADLRGEPCALRARQRAIEHEPSHPRRPRRPRRSAARGVGGRRLADAFDAVTGDAGAGRGAAAPARPLRAPGDLARRGRRGDRGRHGAGDRGHARGQQRRRARPGRTGGVREAVEALDAERRRARSPTELETYDVLEQPGRRPRSATSASAATRSRCGSAPSGSASWRGCRSATSSRSRRSLHDVGKLVLTELYGDEPGADDARRVARGARSARAPRARHRPRPGRRGARPPLGHADDRRRRRSSATTPPTRPATPRRSGSPTWSSTTRRAIRSRPRRCARPPRRSRSTTHGLSALLFEFPHAASGAAARPSRARSRCARSTRCAGSPRARSTSRSPRSSSLSVSTVRTHLHNVYRKIGAVDRAQAVLIARDRGWL